MISDQFKMILFSVQLYIALIHNMKRHLLLISTNILIEDNLIIVNWLHNIEGITDHSGCITTVKTTRTTGTTITKGTTTTGTITTSTTTSTVTMAK